MPAQPTPTDRASLPVVVSWRLELLGVPSVAHTRLATTHTLSRKDSALLAVIALDGPVASERVAALVWSEVDRRKAEANLRQRLFRMRRDIGADLVSGGEMLRLADDVQTNVQATLADIAIDENAGRAELLGEFQFGELPELAHWVQTARSRWHEQRAQALATAAAQCESSGAIARGLVYAQRLVDGDPLSEHAHRRIMRMHYLRADCSAAIAAFERFEQRLKDELGARPSAETIELLRTIESSASALPTRRAIVPISLVRPPRLVGRADELRTLSGAWAHRRVFALFGEAGIGKTRLLQEFAASHDGVASVQGRPGDAGIAYAVLARLLRAMLPRFAIELMGARRNEMALLLPELGQPITVAGDAQLRLLHRAVDAAVAQAVQSGLRAVIVDDLHFADEASVEFLQSMTQSDSLSTLDWGFAQRPSELGAAASSLHAGLVETLRLESITLGPLNLAQVTELIESLALPMLDARQLAPALLRHTGGNPMFALETLKDMVHAGSSSGPEALPQPTTVGSLVERRLFQMSPAALKLARVAALAGSAFDAQLSAAVLDVHPLDITEPWRELEAAHVIRDGAFAHDLIFEATRASVPEPIARLLHRRIAEHLQAGGAQSAIVAPHWAGAQEWPLAGEAHVIAARQAQSASQRGHEVEHWRQACICFEKGDRPDRSFDARCESVQALIVVQGVTQANTVIDALLAEARSDQQQVAALTARALAALMAADHQAGIAAATRASELAQRLDSPWPRFEAERLLAVGLAQGGQATRALAIIEPYREQVEREGSAELKGRFWADYAYVLNTARRLRDTAAALGKAIENARSLGDVAELATLTSNLATVQGNLGHVDQALALARQSLALQVQLGTTDGPNGGVVEIYVGLYCGMAGLYEEALERLDSALLRFERDGQKLWRAVAGNHKAQFLIELGQFARARQALEYGTPPVDSVRARGAAIGARIDRFLGQPNRPALDGALELLNRGGDPHLRMHAMLDQAAWFEPDMAIERCEAVVRMAEELEFLGVSMKAGILRAQYLHRAAQTERAAALLRDLLPRLPTVRPADMYLPEAWWIGVQVFDACGAHEEAMLALGQGTRWIRQVALPHVPDAFRDSFLNRNPTNLSILSAASRRLT